MCLYCTVSCETYAREKLCKRNGETGRLFWLKAMSTVMSSIAHLLWKLFSVLLNSIIGTSSRY